MWFTMTTDKELRWIHMRLSGMVKGGRSDLRQLRNKFGLAAQSKATVTERDIENACERIWDNGGM